MNFFCLIVSSYIMLNTPPPNAGQPSLLFDTKNVDWAPSLHLGHGTVPKTSAARYDRAVQRELSKQLSDPHASAHSTKRRKQTKTMEVDAPCSTNVDLSSGDAITTCTQTILTISEMDSLAKAEAEVKELKQICAKLEEENAALRAEKKELQGKSKALDEDFFRDDDEKVRYYTGLTNWNLLVTLIQFVQPSLSTHHRSALSPFQKLILTLMRLRLGLSGQDLGYRFGVHSSTISRTFTTVIDILYKRLKHLILWPERSELKKAMPMDFRKYCPDCVVIIDCFEIFIDRPSALLARSLTYSSYKHHNTVKYLIGITPHGIVSFISNGWGGRVSDKHLTENSCILKKLLPGDTILADRGFDIKDSVGLYCATVKLPSFTKGKK